MSVETPSVIPDHEKVVLVELEGGLVEGTVVPELVLCLLRKNPWGCWKLPLWRLEGADVFERKLLEHMGRSIETLPLRRDVLAYVKELRSDGNRIVLVSGTHEVVAEAVARELGCFDEVITKKSEPKSAAIRIDRTWHADSVPDSKLSMSPFRSWFRMLRPHQWTKNALLVVPLFTSHKIGEIGLILACLTAIASFSLAASSIYIINDLIDLPSDRAHASKRFRPLAAGTVSIGNGFFSALLLLIISFCLTFFLPRQFVFVLCGYIIAAMAYTFDLKRRMLVDVFCLAGLYTLRILAGGAATEIRISVWLMAFSMFMFLSLAFVKRYAELLATVNAGETLLKGRGYKVVDLDLIRSVGPASGYMAPLVACLYLNDRESTAIYRHPEFLALICPLILYWISRVWFVTQRGGMDSDPVLYAVRDRVSLFVGFLCVLIVLLARLI